MCAGGWPRTSAVTECGVQDYMMRLFADRGLETDHPPIVAVAHGADPAAPQRSADTEAHWGDYLLIDM